MSHCAHEKCPCDSAKRQQTPASVAACYPQCVGKRERRRVCLYVCAHCCWLGKVMSKYAGACCLFYNKAKPSTKKYTHTDTHSQFIVKYTIAHTHTHTQAVRQALAHIFIHTYSYSVTYVHIEYGCQMLLIDMHVHMYVNVHMYLCAYLQNVPHRHTHTLTHSPACQFAGETNANVCP